MYGKIMAVYLKILNQIM
uniref:Uncharacterized protein n=1 Tax=Anguilla anguilla TaxID=7936 RepID=A0A0E9X8S1_ANGAN